MEILLSDFVSLKDEMFEKRNKAWWCGCHFYFLPIPCLALSRSPNAPGLVFILTTRWLTEAITCARASDSEDPNESELWHYLTLTLGKSLNLGRVQFPHLWNQRIVVLWEVIVNLMNLSISLTSLVKTYTVFPPPF